jgi:hypothetical protein
VDIDARALGAIRAIHARVLAPVVVEHYPPCHLRQSQSPFGDQRLRKSRLKRSSTARTPTETSARFSTDGKSVRDANHHWVEHLKHNSQIEI